MKHPLLTLLLLFCSHALFAQYPGHWTFRLVEFPPGKPADTVTCEIWSAPGRYRVEEWSTTLHQTVIVDSAARRCLSLDIDYEGIRRARIQHLDHDYLYDEGPRDPEETDEDWYDPELEIGIDYDFVNEQRRINGWKCRKIEFKDPGISPSYGWVALDIHPDFFASEVMDLFHVTAGLIVEANISHEDGTIVSGGLVAYDPKAVMPPGIFSLTIPTGYTDQTDYEELEIQDEE